MPWIEAHQAIERHPKTLELAARMKWNIDTTIGKLMRLWWWSIDYAPDGDLSKFKPTQIALALGVEPEEEQRAQTTTLEALTRSGWIDTEPYLRVHDWWDYVGRFLKVKYKNTPHRWQAVQALYAAAGQGDPDEPSTDDAKTSPNGSPYGTPKTYNQPTDQPNKPTNRTYTSDLPGRTPPSAKDLEADTLDIETFVRIWWGAKNGNLSYPILTQLVQEARRYGKLALGSAIIEAARQNVTKLSYVQAILRPKQPEMPQDRTSPRTATTQALAVVIGRSVEERCLDHPDQRLKGSELCRICFPLCGRCHEQHASEESCEEVQERTRRIKAMFSTQEDQ